MIDFIDLFSGIGGFHLGLHQASGRERIDRAQSIRSIGDCTNATDRRNGGEPDTENSFRCIWANDWDKYAAQIYRKNFPETPFSTDDIREVPADGIPDHDLLCAGFPCQAFSVAGKRRGFEEARGTLFFEIARIAERKRSRLLLLENVKGLLNHDEGRTFRAILRVLDELGYHVEWQVLNSKHFGVPQNRERVFIIGHLGEPPTRTIFPIGEAGEDSIESQEEARSNGARVRDEDQGIAGSLRVGGSGREENLIAGTLSHRYGKDGSENLIMNLPHGYNDGFIKHFPCLGADSGSQYNELLVRPVLTPDRPKKRQHGRRFKDQGEPMFTLTGQDIHGIMYPDIANTVCDGWLMDTSHHDKPMNQYRIRRLTPLECERLQGFPDGFTEGISDTQRYKCLGNAVTVNVIRFLGERISQLYHKNEV